MKNQVLNNKEVLNNKNAKDLGHDYFARPTIFPFLSQNE